MTSSLTFSWLVSNSKKKNHLNDFQSEVKAASLSTCVNFELDLRKHQELKCTTDEYQYTREILDGGGHQTDVCAKYGQLQYFEMITMPGIRTTHISKTYSSTIFKTSNSDLKSQFLNYFDIFFLKSLLILDFQNCQIFKMLRFPKFLDFKASLKT